MRLHLHLTPTTLYSLCPARPQSLENLPVSANLRSLFLGKNKITKIENLEGLTGLQTLSLQSAHSPCLPFPSCADCSSHVIGNRITKIEGLEKCTQLEELYLSHNGLTKIEGLSANVSQNPSSPSLKIRDSDSGFSPEKTYDPRYWEQQDCRS